MPSKPRPWSTAPAVLLTLTLLPGCALFSKPPPVAVQCPAIPSLPQEARQSSELAALLESASADLQRWLTQLEAPTAPAPAAKPRMTR